MASKRTINAKVWYTIFLILHIVCVFGPLCYYIPAAFIAGEVVEKLTLGITAIMAIMVGAISLVVGVTHRAGLHRTMMWLIIIGVMACLSQMQTFIWVIAITSVVDELIITPLLNKYKLIKHTNKEIDRALSR